MDPIDGSVREIATQAEFEAARTAGTGYFVVTDRSTPTRIHTLGCYAVAPEHFRVKVLENQRRRGRYFHAPTADLARARFPKGRPCGLCRPFAAVPKPPTAGPTMGPPGLR